MPCLTETFSASSPAAPPQVTPWHSPNHPESLAMGKLAAILCFGRENHPQFSIKGERKLWLLWHWWVLLQFQNPGRSAPFLSGYGNFVPEKWINLLTWKGPEFLLCQSALQSPWKSFCAAQLCWGYNAKHVFSWWVKAHFLMEWHWRKKALLSWFQLG